MRSIHLMAATTVIVALASACGDGGTDVGNPPVATFTPPSCTAGTACQFTDASTPAGEITAWSWNFGDANAADPDKTSTLQNPVHNYSVAGDYAVTLTVTSSSGSNSVTHTVTATGGAANQPPVASFTLPTCSAGTPCGFHSTSTDADGQIAASHWDFGDQGSADTPDATHTYAAAGTFTVVLTVTDNLGATGTSTQQVTVSPPASQACTTTSGTLVDCSLGVTSRSTVKITLISRSCELAGNKLTVTAPVPQTAFFNLCFRTVGEEYVVKDASGAAALVLEAGAQLGLRFTQGTADPGDPATGDPGIRLEGTFPNWTLKVDDGGNAAAQGEPDFDDVVLIVQATPAP